MDKYIITGIWFKNSIDGSQFVSDVMLHQVVDDVIRKGKKVSAYNVIQLIKEKNEIYTCNWDYNQPSWIQGSPVTYKTSGQSDYLITKRNSKISDNLDNMINMDKFIID